MAIALPLSLHHHDLAPPTRRELLLMTLTITVGVMVGANLGGSASRPQVSTDEVARTGGPTFSQHGRTAIVTGSSKGIGKGIAIVFAEAGANVLVTSRHLAEAEAVAQEIVQAGGVASAFEGDVSIEADVKRMVSTAVDRYGGIDVVCANAGMMPDQTIATMSEADWDLAFSVNVKGTFLTVKHAIPYLKKSPYGRVVLTSSVTGPITGFPGWAHYGATKAAQLGFMRSAMTELAPSGVTINAVMPGNIMTEGLAVLGDTFLDGVRAAIPLGAIGAVRDVGYACLYFASREAGFVTGTTLVVDGGQVVPETEGFRAKWQATGLA